MREHKKEVNMYLNKMYADKGIHDKGIHDKGMHDRGKYRSEVNVLRLYYEDNFKHLKLYV